MPGTSVSYRCPRCGAPLTFLPGHSHVTCEYCSNRISIAEMEALFSAQQEQAAAAAEAQEARWNTENAGGEWDAAETANMMIQTCSACGAELVSDGNTMATECAYCGSPNMIPRRFDGMLRPDFIIPFKKTKEEAIAALKETYKGKRLLPDAFSNENRIREIQSMYVPFWLFDARVSAEVNFEAERRSSYETADDTVTEVSYYSCGRNGEMTFRGIPVDASKRMDDSYMDSIEPFDYAELRPFSAAYFTGHLADKYDVDVAESLPRADRRLESSVIGALDNTLTGYSSTSLSGSPKIRKAEGNVSYAMMPVWILTTNYKGKPYTFMMNGQTGKFVGSDLPEDKFKAVVYPLVPAALVFAVVVCLGWLIFDL